MGIAFSSAFEIQLLTKFVMLMNKKLKCILFNEKLKMKVIFKLKLKSKNVIQYVCWVISYSIININLVSVEIVGDCKV